MPELLMGSPDTISRRIKEASNVVPIEECFLLVLQGVHTCDQIMTSLELFADRVMPRFSNFPSAKAQIAEVVDGD